MTNDDLRDEAVDVKLCIGDMIRDIRTKSLGILYKRERRIDIIEDDIYVWSIYWFSQNKGTSNYNNPSYFEEDALKMFITLGMIDLFSASKGDNDG